MGDASLQRQGCRSQSCPHQGSRWLRLPHLPLLQGQWRPEGGFGGEARSCRVSQPWAERHAGLTFVTVKGLMELPALHLSAMGSMGLLAAEEVTATQMKGAACLARTQYMRIYLSGSLTQHQVNRGCQLVPQNMHTPRSLLQGPDLEPPRAGLAV